MVRLALILSALALSACSTVSKFTIEDRLQELGLSASRADCMADQLERRLNDRQLRKFADFTVTLTSKNSPFEVIDALGRISDPEIGGAVAASSVACIIS
ncbi:hypothetical protein [Parvularcula sp. LCG005]|uniref:hypothetical protein n=1 Tax=Parvularcula sp. LCG005 TaxID=3078805 RepID=UPI0029436844|nr:hypothetical protein [Parvularcula sp. LCG005]WOI53630.1 hypothetical protein RUI03_01220 [Parvularcula sp. LCG005]